MNPRNGASSRSVGDILRDSAVHAQDIIRGEVRLAIAEATDEVRAGVRRAVLGVCALFGVLLGATLGLCALIAALAQTMPLWLALLVVAATTLMLAILLGVAATHAAANPSSIHTPPARSHDINDARTGSRIGLPQTAIARVTD